MIVWGESRRTLEDWGFREEIKIWRFTINNSFIKVSSNYNKKQIENNNFRC